MNRHPSSNSASFEKLAPRELEVLTLTACGKTRPEISLLMSVSKETVKAYLERARTKLNAVNKTHAAAIAVLLGLVSAQSILPPITGNPVTKKVKLAPHMGTDAGAKLSLLPNNEKPRHPKRRDSNRK
jgi:DNA-binding CsgD family transcriptional regulator